LIRQDNTLLLLFDRLMDEKPVTENRAAHILFLRAALAAEKSERAAKQAAISAAQAVNYPALNGGACESKLG
jgi:hypothetical protein